MRFVESLDELRDFQRRCADRAPAAVARIKETALAGGNVFDAILSAAEVLSLGQITRTLYEVGGQYRRSM